MSIFEIIKIQLHSHGCVLDTKKYNYTYTSVVSKNNSVRVAFRTVFVELFKTLFVAWKCLGDLSGVSTVRTDFSTRFGPDGRTLEEKMDPSATQKYNRLLEKGGKTSCSAFVEIDVLVLKLVFLVEETAFHWTGEAAFMVAYPIKKKVPLQRPCVSEDIGPFRTPTLLS